MPVIFLWAIPAVIVVGGGGYWLMHMHRDLSKKGLLRERALLFILTLESHL